MGAIFSFLAGKKTFAIAAMMIVNAIMSGFGTMPAGGTDWNVYSMGSIDWNLFYEGMGLGALREGVRTTMTKKK